METPTPCWIERPTALAHAHVVSEAAGLTEGQAHMRVASDGTPLLVALLDDAKQRLGSP